MTHRVIYYTSENHVYSHLIEDDVEEGFFYENGDWYKPFDKSSPAIGYKETLLQSDECPPVFHRLGISRIYCYPVLLDQDGTILAFGN